MFTLRILETRYKADLSAVISYHMKELEKLQAGEYLMSPWKCGGHVGELPMTTGVCLCVCVCVCILVYALIKKINLYINTQTMKYICYRVFGTFPTCYVAHICSHFKLDMRVHEKS